MFDHLAIEERLGMSEEHEVVIRNPEDGSFWGGRGWVEEYPDAQSFTASADDEDAMDDVEARAMEKANEVAERYPEVETIEVVSGYGYAFEEVVGYGRKRRRDRAA